MQPLKGLTVVTLEHAIAAPFATRQLADLGARVIKIERPGVGDFARGYDERVRGLASHFVWTNRSKESLTLDVKHPEAAEVLRAPGAREGRRRGAEPRARRRGAAGPGLRRAGGAASPALIVCDISGYGDDGPYRDKKAYDLLIQSEAGFVSVTGTPDEPCKAGPSIADIAAGMYAYTNILAALLQRGADRRAASTSTSRCSSRWPSGRATRCTTPSTARRRRRAPARPRDDLPLRPVPGRRRRHRDAGPAERARVGQLLRQGAAAARSSRRDPRFTGNAKRVAERDGAARDHRRGVRAADRARRWSSGSRRRRSPTRASTRCTRCGSTRS